MRTKDYLKLKEKDFIIHKHYGLCIIDNIKIGYCKNEIFGLIIKPLSTKGIMRLVKETGVLFNTLIETSKRLILEKVENPIIPKILFKDNDNTYKLYEWTELGKITDEGELSVKCIKQFSSLEQLQDYKKISKECSDWFDGKPFGEMVE